MTAVIEGDRDASTPSRSRITIPPATHWRVWVTKHPIGGAALAGFMATWIATIFGFWLGGIGLPQLNWPIANGAVVLAKSSEAVQFTAGEFIHGIDGIVFTIIVATFIFPMLGRARTPAANMGRALLFAFVLATLSAGFLVPYVYYPHVGAGIFGSGFGWKVVFAVYVWHLVFGVNLGLLYSPLSADDKALSA
jgi:hypothetical protein